MLPTCFPHSPHEYFGPAHTQAGRQAGRHTHTQNNTGYSPAHVHAQADRQAGRHACTRTHAHIHGYKIIHTSLNSLLFHFVVSHLDGKC